MRLYAKTSIIPQAKPMSVEGSLIRSLYMQAKECAKSPNYNCDIGGKPYVELIKLFREFAEADGISLRHAKEAIDCCCGVMNPEGEREQQLYKVRFDDDESTYNLIKLFMRHSSEVPAEKEPMKKLVDEKGMEVIRARFNEEIAKKKESANHFEQLANDSANSAHVWGLAMKVVESNSDGEMTERLRTILETLGDESNHAQQEANSYAREARNALAQIETLNNALKIVEDVVNQGVK